MLSSAPFLRRPPTAANHACKYIDPCSLENDGVTFQVQMLGSGRLFLVEIQNACLLAFEVIINELQSKINSSENKLVGVRNLKVVGSEGWALVQEGEAEKQIDTRKPYSQAELDEVRVELVEFLGATYQRIMQRIFDDILHKHVECYVDDLVVKSKKKCDHLKDLKLVLNRLWKYQLRMNPLKHLSGLTSGKFLGFARLFPPKPRDRHRRTLAVQLLVVVPLFAPSPLLPRVPSNETSCYTAFLLQPLCVLTHRRSHHHWLSGDFRAERGRDQRSENLNLGEDVDGELYEAHVSYSRAVYLVCYRDWIGLDGCCYCGRCLAMVGLATGYWWTNGHE
uniref:Reverse transcriptase domain-containing protein n=1 Tax=Cucumis melo TaxID=3656 RepID=A0A9I9EKI7_CUCME